MADTDYNPSFNLNKSKLERLSQKIIKSSDDFLNKKLPEQRNLRSVTNELISSRDIKGLLRAIFNLKFVKNFQLIQICFHQKSYSQAKIVSSDPGGLLNNGDLSASEFHQYLQTVKKSKNKFFQTGVETFPHFHSVGTFLAKEFIFPDISFILILSRNDFLRPTDEEYDNFYSTCELLKEKIRKVLLATEESQKTEIIARISSFLEDAIENPSENTSPLVSFYQNERLKLMADLLDTLKHELSNPLFGISLAVENLIEFEDSESQSIQTEILSNIARSQSIINNFVSLYENKNINEEFCLKDAIHEAIVLSKSATAGIAKTYSISNEGSFIINNNKTSIIQIIFNAIVNAAQAMGQIDHSQKSINIQVEEDQGITSLKIIDNGPGMEDEDHEKYFQPFYTTKEKGTGLGLSICHSLAESVGGHIILKNREDSPGAIFELRISNT